MVNSKWFILPDQGNSSFFADFSINGATTCRKPCCVDITSFVDTISLCDVPSYRLPNSDVVTVSNTYYHFYKTEKGCDSIVYYPVVFQNKPAINLGADDCLEDKDSIILKADTGYLIYNWMNQLSNQPVYVIQNPGTFWVTVTNKCGTASDSITIYKDCEFETYIPSAFTPNNDNINDYFNIPKQNRNKLIELTVYNRYGGIVYKTKDMNAGWNGTFKYTTTDRYLCLLYKNGSFIRTKNQQKRNYYPDQVK